MFWVSHMEALWDFEVWSDERIVMGEVGQHGRTFAFVSLCKPEEQTRKYTSSIARLCHQSLVPRKMSSGQTPDSKRSLKHLHVIPGMKDLTAFKHLFSGSVRKKLSNDHIWVSVMSRPTRSNFTRVQRVSCCVALLFLTMITNCMFFRSDSEQPEKTEEAITVSTAGRGTEGTEEGLWESWGSTVGVLPQELRVDLLWEE